MISNWSYSPETLNSGKNRRFFVPCDLEIWRMTLKKRGHLSCAASSWVHHFIAIGELKLELQTNLSQNGRYFMSCDLEIWGMTLKNNRAPLLQHQALCIIFSPCVNSNWNYGPETAKWGHDLCDLDLLPLTFTFCMDITSVNGKNSWKFQDDTITGTLWKRCKSRTDVQADGQKCSKSCLVASKNTKLGKQIIRSNYDILFFQ